MEETVVTAPSPNPLREMWKASGKTAQAIAEEMRIELGEKRRHLTSVTKFVRVGGYKRPVHRAFAHAVGVDEETVASAAERLARNNAIT